LLEATVTPLEKGALCFLGRLTPGESGVLSREAAGRMIRVIPPIHLKVAVAQPFGIVKQSFSAVALLSFDESEVGETLIAKTVIDKLDVGLGVSYGPLEIGPAKRKPYVLNLSVDRDMPPGQHEIVVRLVPQQPVGFEDRALTVTLPVTVIPLTFWERHGRMIKLGLIALFFVVFMLGLVLPARFRRTAILHYEDRRDPTLPRQAKFPLGAKARAGFYSSARVVIGPMGPVRRGGDIEIMAGPGGLCARASPRGEAAAGAAA
jgi:hypothetical protein